MSTSAGKYDVLNPSGRKPIDKVDWNRTDFEKEISARVDLYVVEYLQSNRVLKKFKKIAEEINDFRQKIISSLEKMESEWAKLKPNVEETESSTYLIQLGLLTSPVWIAALAFGFGIPAAVFGSIFFAVSSFFNWVTKTSKEIDDEYNRCIMAVPKRMNTLLEDKCGSNIRKNDRKGYERTSSTYRSINRKIKSNIGKTRSNPCKSRSAPEPQSKDKYDGEICYAIKDRFEFINTMYCYGL